MKQNFIISLIVLFSFWGGAFVFSLSAKNAEKKEVVCESFSFHLPGGIPEYAGEVEPHFLGDSIAVRWSAFQAAYIRSVDLSVGFSNSDIDIFKPAVFNSIEKINRFLKKKLSRREISEKDAISLLMHILNCSLVIVYEPETDVFEAALNRAKYPEKQIEIFRKVTLIF